MTAREGRGSIHALFSHFGDSPLWPEVKILRHDKPILLVFLIR
jgi:hypothetical protein